MPEDPMMLLSFVNMKLRDEYEDMDELCRAFDADRGDIDRRLLKLGYRYDPEQNRYR